MVDIAVSPTLLHPTTRRKASNHPIHVTTTHPSARKLVTVGWLAEHRSRILAAYALVALIVGGLLQLASEESAGTAVWRVGIIVPAGWSTVKSPLQ